MALVLIADPDPSRVRALVERLEQEVDLEAEGFADSDSLLAAVTGAVSSAGASSGLSGTPDAVVVGQGLGGTDDFAVVAALRLRDPDLAVLAIVPAGQRDALRAATAAVGALGCVAGEPVAVPSHAWLHERSQELRSGVDEADFLARLRVALERRELARQVRALGDALASRDQALAQSARDVERATAELRSTHSELATATERLMQAEQLAAVGRVITGIAHELTQQLALVGYAEALKARVARDPELVELADIIVSAQKRLAAMVDEMRDFAAGPSEPASPLARQPADVAGVVEEALHIIGYDRDVRRRTIERRFRARPLCALHHHKFGQVVINLVSNAVLATGEGDTVVVELDVDAEQRTAVLTVVDRGVGMSPEVVARLGEPFFSTRGDRGSGLGVGICRRIVEEHGGALTFESAPGRGTSARVTIPLLTDPDVGAV